jgi:hypothetical protein
VATKVIIAFLFTLALAGLIAIGVSFFNQLACEGQPINNNVSPTFSQQIMGEQILSQSFVAPRADLNRIDILFQTYQRQNTHDVTLRLLEAPSGADNPLQGVELFKATFNAADARDESWHTFRFAPIPDSAGKTYLITLQSPESVNGNAITVGGIERDVYRPGSAFLGPVPVPADISFRACFQMTIFEKLQVLAEQLTRNRPAVWADPLFYGAALLTYLLLLIGLFWRLSKLALP